MFAYKKTSSFTQSGFSHILLPAILIVVIAVLGGVVYIQVSKAATVANADYFQSGISGKCLDDQYDGKTNGTKVQIYTCNKSSAQQWIVTSNGTVENANGSCLDLAGASEANNTHIVMYGCNTNAAQQWKITGSILDNPASGKCVDDPYANTTNGTQLILYTCKGTSNQKWTTVAASGSSTGGDGGSGTTGNGGGTTVSGAFSVSGNKILNSKGQTVLVHGVDRPSLEWSCSGTTITGAGTGIPASDFTTMRNSWNADAVRVAVSEDRWLPGTASTCSTYKTNVETAISNARAAGLIAIVDLHWSDQGNNSNASGQQCMPDQNSITFWQQIATMYKTDPSVWFELYNEPYPPGSSNTAKWATLDNGGSVTCSALVGGKTATWNAPGFQTIVNTIRATGADNIVVAGGLAFSSVLTGEPNLTGGNIAYSVHPYENTSDPDGATDGSWAGNFGNRAAQVPVIATEFGDKQCGDAYDSDILNYFKSNDIGFTGWAWYAGGCAFPSLVNAQGTCAVSMGCTIQADMKTYPSY